MQLHACINVKMLQLITPCLKSEFKEVRISTASYVVLDLVFRVGQNQR